MSATVSTSLFKSYFADSKGASVPPVIEIPGRACPVEECFLEDTMHKSGFVPFNSETVSAGKLTQWEEEWRESGGEQRKQRRSAFKSEGEEEEGEEDGVSEEESEGDDEDGKDEEKEEEEVEDWEKHFDGDDECTAVHSPGGARGPHEFTVERSKLPDKVDRYNDEEINGRLYEHLVGWIHTQHSASLAQAILIFLPGTSDIYAIIRYVDNID